MTTEEHKQRHIELHQALDELVADFVNHTEKLLSTTTVMELVQWSYQQTQNPDEDEPKQDRMIA